MESNTASDRAACGTDHSPHSNTVIVQNLAGNIIWGPTTPESSLTVEELSNKIDRPAWCPEVRLLIGEQELSPDDDVVKIMSYNGNVEFQAVFTPPPTVNQSYVCEFLELAKKSWLEIWEKYLQKQAEKKAEKADSNPDAAQGVAGSSSDDELCEEAGSSSDEEFFEEARQARDEACFRTLTEKFAMRPAYEGISSATTGLSEKLSSKLNSLIDMVKHSQSADYHPGTDKIVRDIVHPSLYPFIAGVSQLPGGLSVEDFRPPGDQDMWGRPYEESVYQWLPAEVSVDTDGKCNFSSYINNLSRERHGELYAALEELLSECLPRFESCLGYATAVKFVPNGDPEEVEQELQEYAAQHLYDLPDDDLYLEQQRKYGGSAQPELEVQDLKGRTLQVIVKIADMEVPPGAAHEGVWHVEGMSHENIVATAEVILQKDPAFSGGDLEFQRAFTFDEAGKIHRFVPQDRSEAVEDFISAGLVPLGRLALPSQALVSWPNSHVHRITPLVNSGEATALRRIVVFWLINPDRRIISTASVAQQQATMPLEIALAHRLKLMEERKWHKQDWNVREISLCEH